MGKWPVGRWVSGKWSVGRWVGGRWSVDLIKPDSLRRLLLTVFIVFAVSSSLDFVKSQFVTDCFIFAASK